MAFATAAQAQGTMDFSGAQTLMGTFKTFAIYAALFYRTQNGSQVGDLFMSLIHTCQLCTVNSFRDRAVAPCSEPGGPARGVDAMELPRDAGAGCRMMDRPGRRHLGNLTAPK